MLLTSKKKINQAEEEMMNVPRGSWAEIWYELKRNRRAMFGLFFILFLTITAIFADQIAPYGMREQNLSNALQFPNTTHWLGDRKSTRLNSSHVSISYAVFCLNK